MWDKKLHGVEGCDCVGDCTLMACCQYCVGVNVALGMIVCILF